MSSGAGRQAFTPTHGPTVGPFQATAREGAPNGHSTGARAGPGLHRAGTFPADVSDGAFTAGPGGHRGG